MERVVCLAAGYAFGLIQTGYLYGKIVHKDIRRYGSGNSGTTNALRVLGKKAGVIVDDLVDSDSVQIPIFDYDMDLRRRQDRISEVMDKVNSSGRNLVRLAAQRSGDYTDGIRCDYRSRHYSTALDEIIEVK